MISSASAVIERGGVLRSVSSRPPLTLRQVSGTAGVCTLCLVGSAAGPLAGDEVDFHLAVAADSQARLVATGASLAQGRGAGTAGRLRSRVTLGDGATLQAEPAAVISCDGSRVEVTVELDLAATASVTWRELLVLGRFGEPPGSVVLDWRVERAGLPLLRQRIDLSDVGLSAWPGMLAGGSVLASAFVSGPAVKARTLVDSPTAVCQQIDDRTALVTVLDSDAASAGRRLDRVLAQLL